MARLIRLTTKLPLSGFSFTLRRAACIIALCALAPVTEASAWAETVSVHADFARPADYPLSRAKFGVYNSGYVPLSHYDRDIHLFDEIKPESLRIDLCLSGTTWTKPPVTGTPGNIQYHFAEVDHVARLLNEHGILPLWDYCYIPTPLRAVTGDATRVTHDKSSWGEILAAFDRHQKQAGPTAHVGYHEIYNEPDNRDFFKSSREDYFELYRIGSRSLRSADADAVIGGPALAFTAAWAPPFLDMVARESLPLDFFSFHFYPHCWGSKKVADVVAQMRADLRKHPSLDTTEMRLDEFNSYPIDYPKSGRQDHYELAAALLEDYAWFLSQPDLTEVNWAQFQDTAGGNWSGMISFDGHRKAVFNAAAIYARMPIDRRQVALSPAGPLGAMASTDDGRASLVIWNRTETNLDLKASLSHVPFACGDLRVYRIDRDHASWGDNPENEKLTPVESLENVATSHLKWNGLIPPRAVIYLEINARQPARPTAPFSARIVRVLHYYPDRGTSAYADFDRPSWTARLGMAQETAAREVIGVVADDLPAHVHVAVATSGRFRKTTAQTCLGLRVDYQVGPNFTHAVLFRERLGSGLAPNISQFDGALPWGTKKTPDQRMDESDFWKFEFQPADFAPPGWTGRIEISFEMENTGPETQAVFALH